MEASYFPAWQHFPKALDELPEPLPGCDSKPAAPWVQH
jgi:hypothetical protein